MAHWDSDATRYVNDRWLSTCARRRDATETGQAVNALLPRSAHYLLEVGSGTGYWLKSGLLSSPRRQVGVDRSFARLRVGGRGDVTVCADGSRLPFRSGSFDAVVMIHSIEYMAPLSPVLRESWRVLGPRGLLVVCTKNPTGIPWRLSLWISEMWHACPHRPSLYGPEKLSGAWPGDMVLLKYLRPRVVTDLRDVNDASRVRLPVWADTFIDCAASLTLRSMKKWTSWHYVIVLRKI